MSEISGYAEHADAAAAEREVSQTCAKTSYTHEFESVKPEDGPDVSTDTSLEHEDVFDENNPVSDENIIMAKRLLKTVRDNMEIMQNIWVSTKNQYGLLGEHMVALWKYNQSHMKVQSNDPENTEPFDRCNGLDNITPKDILEIFTDKHPIGISAYAEGMPAILKSAMQDYLNWVELTKDCRETEAAYLKLLELREEQDMIELVKQKEFIDDPEKKKSVQDAIDNYHSIKFMDYLRNPLSDKEIAIIVNAFGDEKKIDYWIGRSRDKLTQIGLGPSVILEISNFENNHLPDRYHLLNNTTLLYVMWRLVFTDTAPGNKAAKPEVDKIVAMIHALDTVIRHTASDEVLTRIKDNVMALLDQLIQPIYQKYYPDKEIPDKIESTCSSNEEEGLS